MLKTSYLLTALFSTTILASAADYTLHSFKKIQITDKFWSEGAYAGDFNHDGKMDIVSGPFWYEGPDFSRRHEYYPATATFKLKKADGTEEVIPGNEGALGKQNAYSDNFLTYVYDFNGDGWDDIIVYGFPGKECFWYENQGEANPDSKGHWPRHKTIDVLDNESPMFGDLTGDGKPEIVCNSKGNLGYATADWNNPTAPWTFHPVSPKDAKKWFCYTHGIGFGDVNGDQRIDLLEKDGWWEQPSSLSGDPVWAFHAFPFAPNTGAAQMYAYDVNGDGFNDIITTLNPHGYGMAWYEQYREGGELKFKQHVFMNKEPKDSKYGVKFSQPHGIDLIDMDGDGLKDIVTGKRFWAHGPSGDVEPNAAAVLYWFKLVRNADKTVDYIPYLVDDNSGVGTEVATLKVSGGKNPDIVVGNKRGTFVFIHETKTVSKEEWEKAQPKPLAGN